MIFAFTVNVTIAQITGQISLGTSFSEIDNLHFSQQALIGYNLKGNILNLRIRASLTNSPYTPPYVVTGGKHPTKIVDKTYLDLGGSIIYTKGLIQIENGISVTNELMAVYNSGLFIKLRNRLYLGLTNSYMIGTQIYGYRINRTGLCISMSN